MTSHLSSGGRGLEAGRALGGARLGVGLGSTLDGRVRVLVLLAGAVDGDLDGDLAALDLLAVHSGAGLLLDLLSGEGDEAEATTLAGLVASLELADHELGDGTESNLGRSRVVLSEDLEELGGTVSKGSMCVGGCEYAYLLLTKIVGEVGNHDLGLAGDTVLRRATLLAGAVGVGLAGVVGVDSEALASGGGQSLVGGLGERSSLAGNVGRGAVGGSLALAVDSALSSLALLATAAASCTATTATATATSGLATTGSALTTLGGLSGRLGLAGKLDGDLAVEDGLAVQLLDGTVGLGGGGHVNEGVADRAGGARVGGDGGGLAVKHVLVATALIIKSGGIAHTQGSP